MKLLEQIVEYEDKLKKELLAAKTLGEKVYIYGASAGGRNAAALLKKYGVEYNGFVVDDEYYRGSDDKVYSLSQVLTEAKEKIALLNAHAKLDNNKIDADKIHLLNYDCFVGSEETCTDDLTYDWCKKNERELQWVYDVLEDEVSRKTLVAYINQKICKEYGYLSDVLAEGEQYFPDQIIRLHDEEVFVDCGAYDGDTIKSYISIINEKNINSTIYAFEPDPYNFERLMKAYGKNAHCINKAVSSEKGTISFKSCGMQGQICEVGNVNVQKNSIDSELHNVMISFIKMDVEGEEMNALHGAKETIVTKKPKLAICIYHKKEDLIEIPKYIKELNESYKLYIRAHMDGCAELVLYAVEK